MFKYICMEKTEEDEEDEERKKERKGKRRKGVGTKVEGRQDLNCQYV